jgi:hypothetical protein
VLVAEAAAAITVAATQLYYQKQAAPSLAAAVAVAEVAVVEGVTVAVVDGGFRVNLKKRQRQLLNPKLETCRSNCYQQILPPRL